MKLYPDAYRYAYLVDLLGIDPGNILCLTFTNKAAAEMRNRINKLIGGEHASDFICTIHSFCVKFLREEIFRLGYPKTFQILDEDDMKAIVKEALEEHNIERKESTVERFIKDFYKIKAFSEGSYISGFLEGDSVMHDHFGCGIIRNIYDNGEYCEVEFWESGLRALKTEKLKKM